MISQLEASNSCMTPSQKTRDVSAKPIAIIVETDKQLNLYTPITDIHSMCVGCLTGSEGEEGKVCFFCPVDETVLGHSLDNCSTRMIVASNCKERNY